MRGVFVLGRAIFGGFFVYNGINHFLNVDSMRHYAEHKGVPNAGVAVRTTGTMLLAGGLSVMAGFKPKEGLAALVAFLIPTAFQMHRFWEEQDENRRMQELTNFSKNLALAGAAMALMQVPDPWPASIDEVVHEDEEMFVRLGGRDLRSLPT